jgi:hypothetical protein
MDLFSTGTRGAASSSIPGRASAWVCGVTRALNRYTKRRTFSPVSPLLALVLFIIALSGFDYSKSVRLNEQISSLEHRYEQQVRRLENARYPSASAGWWDAPQLLLKTREAAALRRFLDALEKRRFGEQDGLSNEFSALGRLTAEYHAER